MNQIQNANLIIAVDFFENESLYNEANELAKSFNIPF